MTTRVLLVDELGTEVSMRPPLDAKQNIPQG